MTVTTAPAPPAVPTAPTPRGPAMFAPLGERLAPFGTLLDVAEVIEGDGPWMIGGVAAEVDACVVGRTTTGDPCTPDQLVPDSLAAWTEAVPFGLYSYLECRTVGMDFDGAKAKAEAALTRSQAAAVEHGFLETVLAPRAMIINDDVWDLDQAIGMLEGALGQLYGSVGVLHLPRSVVATVAGPQHFQLDGLLGEQIKTFLGSSVVASSGLEDQTALDGTPLTPVGATPAAHDETFLYATGAVRVHLSDISTVGPTFDLQHNEFSVLSQRTAAVLVDCVVLAVRVSGCV